MFRPTPDLIAPRRLLRTSLALVAALLSVECLGDFLPPTPDVYDVEYVSAQTDTLNVGETVTAPALKLTVNGKAATTSWRATVLTGTDVVSVDTLTNKLVVLKPGVATVRVRPLSTAITDTTLHLEFTLVAVTPRIIITGADTAFSIGDTIQAIGTPSTSAGVAIPGPTVTWSVVGLDTAAVLIDATSGRIRAIKNGDLTIKAKTDTATQTKVIRVRQRVSKVAVSPGGVSLTTGAATLSAVATDARGAVIASPGAIAWTTLSPALVSVGAATGVVSPVANGQGWIAATVGGVSGYSVVTVANSATTAVNVWVPTVSGVTSSLNGVWAASAGIAYAVGDGGVVRGWNGANWNTVSVNAGSNKLNAVWGSSASNVYVVGDGGTVRQWDGTNWNSLTVPSGTYSTVWGAAPQEMFIGGASQTLRNNTGAWLVSLANSGAAQGMWGSSAANVLMSTSNTLNAFGGSTWLSNPANAGFFGIWGTSATDYFIAGPNGEVRRSDGTAVTLLGGGQTLRAIWGTGTTDLYAVGDGGKIARFNGTSWSNMTSGVTSDLKSVAGFGSDVFVVGAAGVILRGIRGGSVAVSPATPSLTTVGATQQLTATTKDASNATLSVTPIWSSSDASIATVNSSGLVTAVASGIANVCATVPGGALGCAAVSVNTLGIATIDVSPAGVSTTAATTLTAVAKNASGGTVSGVTFTWSSLNPAVATVNSSSGAVTPVANGQVTIAATASGVAGYAVVTVTTLLPSQVNLWLPMASGTTSALNGVWGSSSTNVYAVGQGGTILKYNGSGWNPPVPGATTEDLYGAWGTGDRFWASGGGGQVVYFNGTSWVTTSAAFPHWVNGIWGTAPNNVWAVGGNFGSADTLVRFDGTTWTGPTQRLSTSIMRGIWGSAANDMWAVGQNRTLMRNTGSGWNVFSLGGADLQGVWGLSTSNVFAVGDGGLIQKFDGSSWNAMTSGIATKLTSVWGTSASEVFAVGQGGVIRRYDGSSWSAMTSGVTADLNGVWGGAGPDVFIVGSGGTILRGLRGTTLTVSPSAPTMTSVSATQQLTPSLKDAANNVLSGATLTWASSSPTVATVNSSGVVTAVADGATTVCATAPGGVQGCSTVTVNSQNVAVVVVSPNGATLSGATTTLTAQARNASDVAISGVVFTWASTNPSVATVNSSGLVTAVTSGQVAIAATTAGVTGYTVVNVTVASTTPVNLWGTATSATGQTLFDVWAADKNNVFAVGGQGVVVRYNGSAWARIDSGSAQAFLGVSGTSANDVYAAGPAAQIRHFDGTNWIAMSHTLGSLWDVWAATPKEAYAVSSFNNGVSNTVLGRYNGTAWQAVDTIANTTPNTVAGTGYLNAIIGLNTGGVFIWPSDATPTAVASQFVSGLWGSGTGLYASVGNGGGVYKTTNGLGTWVALPTLPSGVACCNAVWGTSPSEVWATAQTAGVVARYNGAAWDTVNTGAGVQLTGIGGTSNGDVWAVGPGGKIMRGVRGGSVALAPTATTLTSIGGTQQLTPTAKDAANNTIGGVTYSWLSNNTGIVTVNSSGLVTAVADGSTTVCATAAGGAQGCTAVSVTTQTIATIVVTPGVTMSGGNTTFAATAKNAGGNTITGVNFAWTSLNPNVATVDPSTGVVTAVSSGQASIAAAVGGITGYGLVTVTTAGATAVNLWTPMTVTAPMTATANAIWGASATSVIAVNDNGVALRLNGSVWDVDNVPPSGSFALNGVWGTSMSDLFAVGNNHTIVHYNGSAWAAQSNPASAGIADVWGSSPRDVFAVGANGLIMHYDGSVWTSMTSNTSNTLSAVYGFTAGIVFAVGANSTVLRYDGTTWSSAASGLPAGESLVGLWGTSAANLFAAGASSGTIYRYNGTVWASQTAAGSGVPQGVWGSSGSDVYVVGALGRVNRFDGANWSLLTSGTTEGLTSVWGTVGGDIWAVGGSGIVLRGVRGATVTLAPSGPTLVSIGATQQLTPTAKDASNATITVTGYTWASTTPSVATVNGSGVVTSVANGTTTVCATAPGGAQGCTSVTVGQSPATITIAPNSATVSSGSIALNAIIKDAGGNTMSGSPLWSSLNPAVATVNALNGVITPVSSGQVTVSAAVGGVVGYALVTVSAPSVTAVNLWAQTPSATGQDLYAVWAADPTHVWAVGEQGVVVRWNGSSWTRQDSVGAVRLTGITGRSATDVVTVSNGLSGHFNGSAWTWQTIPGMNVFQVWSASPANELAVGNDVSYNYLLRYNGSSWVVVDTVPGSSQVVAPVAFWGSSVDSLFVGYTDGAIRKRSGSVWSAPSLQSHQIYNLWGPSLSTVYASLTGGGGVVQTTNGGQSWSLLPAPPMVTCCLGIWGSSANELWGGTSNPGFMARYNGVVWDTVRVSATNSNVYLGVGGTSNGDVWAVGTSGAIMRGVRGGSVVVAPSSPTLAGVGVTQQLTATARDASASTIAGTVSYTWSSSDQSVATVNPSGVVTAVAVGNATITATAPGGASNSATVTVTSASHYVVTSSNFSPVAGSNVTITAQLADAGNNPVATAGKTVTWSSTNGGSFPAGPTSVTNSSGVATATFTTTTSSAISHAVTATDNTGLVGTTAAITTVAGAADNYLVTSSNAAPAAGAVVTISAQTRDINGNDVAAAGATVTWSKSNANGSFAAPTSTTNGAGLATVQFTTHTVSGTATTVTATTAGVTGTSPTITTTVGALASISVSPGGAAISSGTVTLSATTKDANSNTIFGAPITWSSLNTAVATVNSSSGVVTPVGNGQVTIAATSGSIVGYGVVTVAASTASLVNLWYTHAGPSANALWEIWAPTSQRAFAAGDNGKVSSWDGNSWTTLAIAGSSPLYGVHGVSPTDVFAVGISSAYHYNGSQWTQQTLPASSSPEAVWAAAPNNVFAVGTAGGIVRYDGTSWSAMTSNTSAELRSVWGTSASDVWAVGVAGTIVHYDGSAWAVVNTGLSVPEDLLKVRVWGQTVIVVGASNGSGAVMLRYNGSAWSRISVPGENGYLQALAGATAADAHASGGNAQMWHFDGSAWTVGASLTSGGVMGLTTIPGSPDLFGVTITGNVIRGVGGATVTLSPATPTINAFGATQQLSATAKDAANTTLNGPTFTWSSATPSVATVSGTGLVTAVANGTSNVCATAPGGAQGCTTVTVAQAAATVSVTPLGATLTTSNVTFTATVKDANGNVISGAPVSWGLLNANIGQISVSGVVSPVSTQSGSVSGQSVVQAQSGSVVGHALVTVAVPGASPVNLWASMVSGTTEQLHGVHAMSASNVYAVGDNGTILHFNGTSWVTEAGGTSESLNAVWGPGTGELWATGIGQVGHFTGGAWSTQTVSGAGQLMSIWGTSYFDVFAVDFDGKIFHYDGVAWSQMTSSNTQPLTGIWGFARNDVFAVGHAGTILHYDGSTWSSQTSGMSLRLQGVWGTAANNVYAVAYDEKKLLKYNGTSWSATSTITFPWAVWGSSASDAYLIPTCAQCWIMRYNGATVDTLPLSGNASFLFGIGGTGGDVFVVGDAGTIVRGYRDATVSVTPATATPIAIGATLQMTATGKDASNNSLSGVTFAWSSTQSGVATVNSSGLVTGVSTGTSSICATARGGAQACTTVTVGIEFTATHGVVQVNSQSSTSLTGLTISGANRLLICLIGFDSGLSLSSIFLDDGAGGGSQSFAGALGGSFGNPTSNMRWGTVYMLAPTTGSGRRVTLTMNGSSSTLFLGCVSYSGVNQSTPFGSAVSTSGNSGSASLQLTSTADGSVPWAVLVAAGAYQPGTGTTDRQILLFNRGAMVDGNTKISNGNSHTFNWDYSLEFGAQGAMIKPAP